MSQQVTQYTCAEVAELMYSPDEQGNWVRYSAYAAIEAQVTALKAENERLRNAAQALADVMETCVEENN